MATKISSIETILNQLNGDKKTGPWSVAPSYYAIPVAELGINQITTKPVYIGIKAFINGQTGEIKLFVAKWIDDEASKLLP